MLHGPAVSSGKDYAIAYKMRLGVWMFLLYALVYAGFVIINVMSPVKMEMPVFLGLNLAVVYGFGLIIFALILALIYNSLCTRKELAMNSGKNDEEAQ